MPNYVPNYVPNHVPNYVPNYVSNYVSNYVPTKCLMWWLMRGLRKHFAERHAYHMPNRTADAFLMQAHMEQLYSTGKCSRSDLDEGCLNYLYSLPHSSSIAAVEVNLA